MPKTRSGLTGSDRPRIGDIDTLGEKLGREGRIAWLMGLGVDRKQAEAAEKVMTDYSEGDYDVIHDGTNKAANDIIDAILDNSKAPIFTGEQFRGVYVSPDAAKKFGGTTPREYLNYIISTGEWKEPGATSFSATQSVAEDFGKFYLDKRLNGGVSVLLSYRSGRSGMPFKHLSSFPGEDEVLHSGKQMHDGMKIVSHEWKDGYRGLELYLVLDDKKKK